MIGFDWDICLFYVYGGFICFEIFGIMLTVVCDMQCEFDGVVPMKTFELQILENFCNQCV